VVWTERAVHALLLVPIVEEGCVLVVEADELRDNCEEASSAASKSRTDALALIRSSFSVLGITLIPLATAQLKRI